MVKKPRRRAKKASQSDCVVNSLSESESKLSVRGFQSSRVTFVTLALSDGVPEELMREVMGHKTAEIVREHYFEPGRMALRRTLTENMPALFSLRSPHTHAARQGEAVMNVTVAEFNEMTALNWTVIRDRLLSRIAAEP